MTLSRTDVSLPLFVLPFPSLKINFKNLKKKKALKNMSSRQDKKKLLALGNTRSRDESAACSPGEKQALTSSPA